MILLFTPIYHSVTSRPFAVISNKDLPRLPMGTKPLKYLAPDYTLSRLLTLRLYYDRQQNTPLISSSFVPGCQVPTSVSV